MLSPGLIDPMPDARIERLCDCVSHDTTGTHPSPSCDRCGGSGWIPTGPPAPGISTLLERLLDRLDAIERRVDRIEHPPATG